MVAGRRQARVGAGSLHSLKTGPGCKLTKGFIQAGLCQIWWRLQPILLETGQPGSQDQMHGWHLALHTHTRTHTHTLLRWYVYESYTFLTAYTGKKKALHGCHSFGIPKATCHSRAPDHINFQGDNEMTGHRDPLVSGFLGVVCTSSTWFLKEADHQQLTSAGMGSIPAPQIPLCSSFI